VRRFVGPARGSPGEGLCVCRSYSVWYGEFERGGWNLSSFRNLATVIDGRGRHSDGDGEPEIGEIDTRVASVLMGKPRCVRVRGLIRIGSIGSSSIG
jgi:hypothetical protein